MAKYEPLRDYLNTPPPSTERVRLTFDEIGKMVGGLPRSASKHKHMTPNTAAASFRAQEAEHGTRNAQTRAERRCEAPP